MHAIRLRAALAVTLVAALMLGQALAREPMVIAWDCWVDESKRIVEIRCIYDRDGNVVDERGATKRRETLLEHIHRMIHDGDAAQLSALFADNWHALNDDDLLSIVIFSSPYPSSWAEGRPETLVRSLLCPGAVKCRVFMRRPDGVPP